MRNKLATITVILLLLVVIPNTQSPFNQFDYPDKDPIVADDGAPPVISLLSPANESVVKPFSWIDIDITDNVAVSLVLYRWSLMIDNETFEAPYDLMARTSEVGHYLYVYANDTSDTWTSAVFYFVSDSTEPEVDLITPINNTLAPSGIDINVTVTDIHLTDVFYQWDEQEILYIWSEPYSTQLISGDGPHTLHVHANDSAGNWMETYFVFIVDDLAPIITLRDLTNGTARRTTSIVEVDILDSSIEFVLYNWETDVQNQTWTEPYLTVIPAGEILHTLRVYANDSFGRWQSIRFTFIGDDTIPEILLDSPVNESIQRAGIEVIISASDIHLMSVSYSWDNGLNQTGSITTPYGDGEHILRVYANDTAGNMGVGTFGFWVDETPPEVSNPENIVITGEQYLVVEWDVSDANPGMYVILLNGTEVKSGTWEGVIYFSMLHDQSFPVTYNCTVIVSDAVGNSVFDTVMAIILTPLPPVDFTPTFPFALIGIVAGSGSVAVVLILYVLKKRGVILSK